MSRHPKYPTLSAITHSFESIRISEGHHSALDSPYVRGRQ